MTAPRDRSDHPEYAEYPDYPTPDVGSIEGLAPFAARAYGDASAFERPSGAAVTYRQLAGAVDHVAWLLAPLGGATVALRVADPCLFAVAFLACARAGCDVVALAPGQRAARGVEALRPAATLDEAGVARAVRDLPGALVPPPALAAMGAEGSDGRAGLGGEDARDVPGRTGDAPAGCACAAGRAGGGRVVLQSSGTTGEPKAVVLSRAGIHADMLAGLRKYEFARGARYVSVIPVTHAFGLTCDLLAPLATGGTVCVPRDPRAALAELAGFSPTALNVPPAVAEALLRMARASAGTGGTAREALRALAGGRLRKMLCGGAGLARQTCAGLRELGVEAFGCYGLTECGPCVCVNRDRLHKDGSCGVALGCNEVRVSPTGGAPDDPVADAATGAARDGGRRPPGRPGEILVRGENVALGTLGPRGELVPLPGVREGGWLRTGDRGSLDRDGFLWTLGRVDDLIVMPDGTKLDPEPVERELARCPLIGDAMVFRRGDGLCARLYVPDPSDAASAEAFARHLGVDGAARSALGAQDADDADAPAAGVPAHGGALPGHVIASVELCDRPLRRTATGKLVRQHEA
ncbi:MAG: AMP-binding protein [Coriobacteriales bacterium]|jgi:long-subunit acyl-CoA synthetase (AMP-forming)